MVRFFRGLEPQEIVLETSLEPEEVVRRVAAGLRERRYWDPKRSPAPFLRLQGSISGPAFELSAKPYVVPDLPARSATLAVSGSISPAIGGAILRASVSRGNLPILLLIGERMCEAAQRVLAAEADTVRQLLAEMLAAGPQSSPTAREVR